MPHQRSLDKQVEREKKRQQYQVHGIILECSFKDTLKGETVFWQLGLKPLKKKVKSLLGYVPMYATDFAFGEVLEDGYGCGSFQRRI